MIKKPPQKKKKPRLDEHLAQIGLFKNKEEAASAILRGRIRRTGSGELLDKPGIAVDSKLEVVVLPLQKFVGRGGEKLEGFLKELNFSVEGLCVLDVGSSTGGFTDCVLQRGAQKVFCVDVGSHQLHEKLRVDSRIELFEQTDIREMDFSKFKQRVDLILVDVSFISLQRVVPILVKSFPDASMIFLFKPQFEVDRSIPKPGGIVRGPEGKESLEEMLLFLQKLGLNPIMLRDSALKGTKGNQETFIMTNRQNSGQSIPPHIFRTYDIRGHADRELSNESMEKIGKVLARRIRAQVGSHAKIGVGRDARISSPRIHENLVRGLQSLPIEVVDLGLVTTPMAYFSHFQFDLDGLLMVTASHNPKDDNGLKMMIAKNTLFGAEITSLGEEAQRETVSSASAPLKPTRKIQNELRQKYLDFHHSQIHLKRKFKIVVDCANGMAGLLARDFFAPYASSLEILFEDVDCTFPNHEADPTVPKNLEPLQKEVLRSKADIGFSFDGDADRLGVITAKGRILWGDEILMLLSELVLQQKPGSTIIGEVKCSEKLFRMVEQNGGRPFMYKTGHSLIKKKMKEMDAPIAGEMSGHLFFADRYFGFDDALYGAIRVLEVMDQLHPDLDTWIQSFPQSFVTPEIRVECLESEKIKLVEGVRNYFEKIKGVRLQLIDGVRVGFLDGSWALVRASNTQSVLVVRIEGTSDARILEIQKQLEEALGRKIEGIHV